MSLRKAQAIANLLEEELGFSLVTYQNTDLEFLKNKIEEFLECDVETEELDDPADCPGDDELDEDDCPLDEDDETEELNLSDED